MEEMAKKHLAEAGELKLGEDTFKLKPLTINELPTLMTVMKEMSKSKDKENFMEAMTEEITGKITTLCDRTMEISYPDLDEETRGAFVMSNFVPLMTKVFEINDLGSKSMSNDRELMSRVKAMKRVSADKPEDKN